MRRDPTEFRKRFAAYRLGKQPYQAGRPVEDDSWTMQDEAGYREWRNNLPDNLRNTDDNDYDMRAAYMSGAQPMFNEEDNKYHLPSRDPRTGLILKSPHHSTFGMALREDAALGYYPRTIRGKTYTSKFKGLNIPKYDTGVSPYDILNNQPVNYIDNVPVNMLEVLVTPTGVGRNYAINNTREMLPIDRTEQRSHEVARAIDQGRREAFPYVAQALSFPIDIATGAELAEGLWLLGKGAYKYGNMALKHPGMMRNIGLNFIKKTIDPTYYSYLQELDKVINDIRRGKYKMDPIEVDLGAFEKKKLPNDQKLFDHLVDSKEELEYVDAVTRIINGYSYAPFPYESTRAINTQIIPRRMRQYALNLSTNGANRGLELSKKYAVNNKYLNPSNPLDLKIMGYEGMTEDEITDFANYIQYEEELKNFNNGVVSLVDRNDLLKTKERLMKTNTLGDFDPNTDLIRVVTNPSLGFHNPSDYVVTHEARHWMDKYIPLLEREKSKLKHAYGKLTTTQRNPNIPEAIDPFVPEDEFITTNQDIRKYIISKFGKNPKSLKEQNKIIEGLTDKLILTALDNSNGYGFKMYEYLQESIKDIKNKLISMGWDDIAINDRISNIVHNRVLDLKEALKEVGMFSGAAYMSKKSINNPHKKK